MSGYSGPITPHEQKQNLTDLILTLHERNIKAQEEIATLRAQLEQERAKSGKMAKFITLNVENYVGDHACKQCFPYSEILVDGFECGYHMAQRLRNQADESEKGGK